jgi:SAM-dependent MidA family methyltransferase
MNPTAKTLPESLSLAARLRRRIKDEGPITFRYWMAAALYDSEDGYYNRSDIQRWGRAGDYRTSPERSPLFAATFARYFNSLYEEMGCPATWTIVECGAGSGQFAEGVLETLGGFYPAAFATLDYVIDELSPDSVRAVGDRLARFASRIRIDSIDKLQIIPRGIVFSNELLDAFPVHRIKLIDGELRELYVTLDQSGGFTWSTGVLSDSRLAGYFEFVGTQLCEGQTADVNLAVEDWLTGVARILSEGYILTVDYGAEAKELFGAPDRREGTLRAFRNHQLVADVLSDPGAQDLTTTVDWTFVRQVGERLGLETIECSGQDRFLLTSGLLEELERKVAGAVDEGERARLRTSAREMILPGSMAASFQVLVQKCRDRESACSSRREGKNCDASQ